jgi:hypothetical protein
MWKKFLLWLGKALLQAAAADAAQHLPSGPSAAPPPPREPRDQP